MALLAACGGGEGTGSTTTTTVVAETTTTAPADSTTTTVGVTTTSGVTTTTQPIDVYFEGGQVVGPDRFSFTVGDEVSIWFLSDTDEEVHVHGYDLIFTAKADVPVEIALVAEATGIFEVELETSHTKLFDLEVTP